MRHDEVAENAALYALGALDDNLRESIDAHVATCDACARVLGEAERDVTVMAAAEPQYDAPEAIGERLNATFARDPAATVVPLRPKRFAWPAFAALAAAFVIGILPSAYFWQENRAMHETMLADSAAIGRLASTPHRMARFAGMNGTGRAQVMYAPDGSWYVVLVQNVSKTLQVAWMHDGSQTMLGAAVPHGDVAMLYLPKSHRMEQLALMDGARVVGQAQLSY